MLSSLQRVLFHLNRAQISQVFVRISPQNTLLSLPYNSSLEMHGMQAARVQEIDRNKQAIELITNVVGGGMIMIDVNKRRRSQRLVCAVQMCVQLREVGQIRYAMHVVLRAAFFCYSGGVGLARHAALATVVDKRHHFLYRRWRTSAWIEKKGATTNRVTGSNKTTTKREAIHNIKRRCFWT